MPFKGFLFYDIETRLPPGYDKPFDESAKRAHQPWGFQYKVTSLEPVESVTEKTRMLLANPTKFLSNDKSREAESGLLKKVSRKFSQDLVGVGWNNQSFDAPVLGHSFGRAKVSGAFAKTRQVDLMVEAQKAFEKIYGFKGGRPFSLRAFTNDLIEAVTEGLSVEDKAFYLARWKISGGKGEITLRSGEKLSGENYYKALAEKGKGGALRSAYKYSIRDADILPFIEAHTRLAHHAIDGSVEINMRLLKKMKRYEQAEAAVKAFPELFNGSNKNGPRIQLTSEETTGKSWLSKWMRDEGKRGKLGLVTGDVAWIANDRRVAGSRSGIVAAQIKYRGEYHRFDLTSQSGKLGMYQLQQKMALEIGDTRALKNLEKRIAHLTYQTPFSAINPKIAKGPAAKIGTRLARRSILSPELREIFSLGGATRREMLAPRLEGMRAVEIVQNYLKKKEIPLLRTGDDVRNFLVSRKMNVSEATKAAEEITNTGKLGSSFRKEGIEGVYVASREKLASMGYKKPGLTGATIAVHEALEGQIRSSGGLDEAWKTVSSHTSHRIYGAEMEFAAMLGPDAVRELSLRRGREIAQLAGKLGTPELKSAENYLSNLPKLYHQILTNRGYSKEEVSEFIEPFLHAPISGKASSVAKAASQPAKLGEQAAHTLDALGPESRLFKLSKGIPLAIGTAIGADVLLSKDKTGPFWGGVAAIGALVGSGFLAKGMSGGRRAGLAGAAYLVTRLIVGGIAGSMDAGHDPAIEGLNESGFAGTRSLETDFGSGWKGLASQRQLRSIFAGDHHISLFGPARARVGLASAHNSIIEGLHDNGFSAGLRHRTTDFGSGFSRAARTAVQKLGKFFGRTTSRVGKLNQLPAGTAYANLRPTLPAPVLRQHLPDIPPIPDHFEFVAQAFVGNTKEQALEAWQHASTRQWWATYEPVLQRGYGQQAENLQFVQQHGQEAFNSLLPEVRKEPVIINEVSRKGNKAQEFKTADVQEAIKQYAHEKGLPISATNSMGDYRPAPVPISRYSQPELYGPSDPNWQWQNRAYNKTVVFAKDNPSFVQNVLLGQASTLSTNPQLLGGSGRAAADAGQVVISRPRNANAELARRVDPTAKTLAQAAPEKVIPKTIEARPFEPHVPKTIFTGEPLQIQEDRIVSEMQAIGNDLDRLSQKIGRVKRQISPRPKVPKTLVDVQRSTGSSVGTMASASPRPAQEIAPAPVVVAAKAVVKPLDKISGQQAKAHNPSVIPGTPKNPVSGAGEPVNDAKSWLKAHRMGVGITLGGLTAAGLVATGWSRARADEHDYAYSSPHGALYRRSHPRALEGFKGGGMNESRRREYSDFGTGRDAVRSMAQALKAVNGSARKLGKRAFQKFLAEPEFQEALRTGEIIGKRGEGGFGSVYEMKQVYKGHTFKYGAKVYDDASSLEEEVRFAKKLQDTYTPTIYGKGETTTIGRRPGDKPGSVVFMELIEGETVEQKIAKGEFTKKAAKSLKQGMVEAHKQGLVHGDPNIKNFLVNQFDETIIIDAMPTSSKLPGLGGKTGHYANEVGRVADDLSVEMILGHSSGQDIEALKLSTFGAGQAVPGIMQMAKDPNKFQKWGTTLARGQKWGSSFKEVMSRVSSQTREAIRRSTPEAFDIAEDIAAKEHLYKKPISAGAPPVLKKGVGQGDLPDLANLKNDLFIAEKTRAQEASNYAQSVNLKSRARERLHQAAVESQHMKTHRSGQMSQGVSPVIDNNYLVTPRR